METRGENRLGKNPDYRPRREAPRWAAGGKVVGVDRVEWRSIPDSQTAINALIAGEVDLVEDPSLDLCCRYRGGTNC